MLITYSLTNEKKISPRDDLVSHTVSLIQRIPQLDVYQKASSRFGEMYEKANIEENYEIMDQLMNEA